MSRIIGRNNEPLAKLMEPTDLEGFIYDVSPSKIQTLYCLRIGEVYVNEKTQVISRSKKPNVGMWCRFSAYCQENGKWFAQRIVLLAYPRLKYVRSDNECIIKGTAVVCNIDGDSGFLWNDYIGLIAMEGKMGSQLEPLIAIDFQAVPLRKDGTSAYFTAKEVSRESENIFQSEVLIFARNAEVKSNNQVHVPGCDVTLLDIACSFRPIAGSTISILYYKEYGNSASGICIYATTDSNTVAGIVDDFFTTERCLEADPDHIKVEQFSGAYEDLDMTENRLVVTDNDMRTIKIDMSSSPVTSMAEFEEAEWNEHSPHSSKVTTGSVDNDTCSVSEVFQSCSSLNSLVLSNGLVHNDQFHSNQDIDEEVPKEAITASNTGPELACSLKDVPAELAKESVNLVENEDQNDDFGDKFSGVSPEDMWDDEFIDHLQSEMKKIDLVQGNEKYCQPNQLIDQFEINSKSSKEELYDELKYGIKEELASVRHIGNVEVAEMKEVTSSDQKLSVANQAAGSMDLRPAQSKDISVEEVKDATWIDEFDRLCVKVLSNPRLRNFVSVNQNGNAVLRDVMYYLERQLTLEDVNKELGISPSEVTPDCFKAVHEMRAIGICQKFMKMNGFEQIANRKIPEIPEC
uniref:Uncharacterized protein n=1 Tax=Setaria digitata TaxID=48799 RepID=A0A915PLX9_9BILA